MLLLLDGKEAALPDWYTSVAMGFKEGKKKTVSFAVVKQDGEKAARRFRLPKHPNPNPNPSPSPNPNPNPNPSPNPNPNPHPNPNPITQVGSSSSRATSPTACAG